MVLNLSDYKIKLKIWRIKMKKICVLILSLVVLISPLTVNAEGFEYDGTELNCESIYMIDTSTGTAVYSYNADEERPIASLTKIMTYIVAYENIENIETVEITVTSKVSNILNATGSSLAGVQVGETFTGLQLLNLMMIPSGNDAALVLALYYDELQGFENEYVGDDEDGVDLRAYYMENSPFVALMNEKAEELGCYNTNFTNPHGLYHVDHYSTARDMSVIAQYATTLPYFMDIVGTNAYTCSPVDSDTERTVYTSNKLFSQYTDSGKYYYQYATGLKTGSLDESGYCLAASAQKDGQSYIVIALGAEMRDDEGNYVSENGAMLDAKNLFVWAFKNLEVTNIILKDDLLSSIPIEYAWDTDTLQLVAAENVKVLLPSGVTRSNLKISIDSEDYVQAPVEKGDVIGVATLEYNGEIIATVNAVASETIERSEIVRIIEFGKDLVFSPVFIAIIVAIFVVAILYIICVVSYNKKKRKMRRSKEFSNRK